MAGCENKVHQTYYRGWETRTVAMRCGQTGLQGDPLECSECRAERSKTNKPPPGYCRHGVFINTDRDIPCAACELGV